jgi:ABC-type nitrate/sulfonate/bicarbonate transport system ATPase subunit
MNVLENVAFGLDMQRVPQDQPRVQSSQPGRAGRILRHYPHELSGGMRQRVAILRAFWSTRDPLMDEPFGALDSQIAAGHAGRAAGIWKENRRTVLYVTHDIEEAILLADQVIVMSGRPGTIRRRADSPRPAASWPTATIRARRAAPADLEDARRRGAAN